MIVQLCKQKLLHVLYSLKVLATLRSAFAGLAAPEQAPDSPDAAASAGGAQLAAGVNKEATVGNLEPDFSNPDTEKTLAKGLRQTLNRLHTMSLPAALVRANSSEAAAQVTAVDLVRFSCWLKQPPLHNVHRSLSGTLQHGLEHVCMLQEAEAEHEDSSKAPAEAVAGLRRHLSRKRSLAFSGRQASPFRALSCVPCQQSPLFAE